jgi:hypothetical protein
LQAPFLDHISLLVQQAKVTVPVAHIQTHRQAWLFLGGFHTLRLFAKLLHWLVSFKHLECVAESLALREASRLIPSKAQLISGRLRHD